MVAVGPFLSPLSQFPCLNVECITYRSVASAMCQVLWRKFFDVIRPVTARDEDVETMTEGALSELMARVKSSEFDGSLSKRRQTS
jgi:hypothetical protein